MDSEQSPAYSYDLYNLFRWGVGKFVEPQYDSYYTSIRQYKYVKTQHTCTVEPSQLGVIELQALVAKERVGLLLL